MLRSLYIKNYALIEEFTIQFSRGLNIITGETGAGKSIVLGAFGLLIGERAAADLIRGGADKAIVEAEFDIEGNPSLREFFVEKDIDCPTNALIIRREVTQRGTSRGFVNDSPVSTQLLKSLGNFIVDLHGQHEHQSLLHAQHHITMLDDFAGLRNTVQRYQQHRTIVLDLAAEIEELRQREAKLRSEHDLFEFQLQEIVAVDPEPEEDVHIDQELLILEHAEELRAAAAEMHLTLYESEGSAYERLGVVKEQLSHLRAMDPTLEEPLKEVQSALAIVGELSNWIGRYGERVDLDPERLASLRERSQRIARLKKKFGGSLDAVLARKSELELKLAFEEEFDQLISDKTRTLLGRSKELGEVAEKLSKARKTAARRLEPQIAAVLKGLGIEHAQFEVLITHTLAKEADRISVNLGDQTVVANARGVDDIEFYISTNQGEQPKPLARVASGGEISRVMLALKTILAKHDRLPLLVFDEIDIGISGRVAQRVGRAMKALAGDHQIIAITHLAQIAAFADSHFQAEKRTSKGSTISVVRGLSAAEHAEEVARLLSGAEVSESSLKNARSLIEEAMAQPV